MLQLKNICKSYTTGDFTQQALKDVSLDFRANEFVAILGQSGSGKTTLLNIIGGLDRYDSGDLVLNGRSTKTFKARQWDAYRNNSVGFIFQSYNLISHISILQNVEMGMALSGVSAAQRRQKALEVLDKVGLTQHAKKRPNQLSGGQMQRVAIARALANDPDIILADEPTGALDSETSVQIMDLIQEIAKDKLVIMVTHNPELAKRYATRIVELKDGAIISDSNPVTAEEDLGRPYQIRKTAMRFSTALKLSFNNIMTKKGRTLLTAFASSIGIIGIALILSLSNGFDRKIDEFEAGTMSEFPVVISRQSMEVTAESMQAMHDGAVGGQDDEYPEEQVAYLYDREAAMMHHINNLSDDYVDYVGRLDPSLTSGIQITRMAATNLLRSDNGTIKPVSSQDIGFSVLPRTMGEPASGVLQNNYDILAGAYPEKDTDILLVVDEKNRIDQNIMELLGFDKTAESVAFDDILGTELRLVMNDDYYQKTGSIYTVNPDLNAAWNSQNTVSLKISGILRIKEDSALTILNEGVVYTDELMTRLLENARGSAIVKAQQDADYNVLTGEKFDLSKEEGVKAREQVLSVLGANGIPMSIMIFPQSFEAKDSILSYLDRYNTGRADADMILYTDLAETVISLSGNIMDAITIVLVAFSSISLVVSVIMIAIITYISVMERTKEIGVLRALGARKKDISRVFNVETFLIGLCSGAIGIGLAFLLLFPANVILESMSDLPNIAQMNPLHALLLVAISLALTVLGGFIPAKMAAKKDPVAALRAE